MLLPIYGGFAACTDGVGKAWIASLAPETGQGGAQGLYQGATGGAVLVAGRDGHAEISCRPEPMEGESMPLYLTQFSYTPATWARLQGSPEDRRQAAQAYIESVGGTLHGFWYAFGTYDGFNLWEAPDNVSMAAVVIAISGGGALSRCETTVLLTVEETLLALGRAAQIGYRPPGD